MSVFRGFRRSGEEGGRSVLILTAMVMLTAIILASGCGEQVREDAPEPTEELTAQQVLERTIDDFISLDSYRYRGTSRMTIPGNEDLDSESRFDTVLQKNEQGAMDGHMTVTSEQTGGSYETYSWRGTEYTRPEGGEWYRVDRSDEGEGYGMVTLDARRVIAEFAELVEDVKLEEETDSEYVISMVMGEGYFRGAGLIADGGQDGSGSGGNAEITMTLTVDKRTLRMLRASMISIAPATANASAVTVVTRSTYSEFNEPMDVEPPPEALNAPYWDFAWPAP